MDWWKTWILTSQKPNELQAEQMQRNLHTYLIEGLPQWLRWWRVCLQCRRLRPSLGQGWNQPSPVFLPEKSHGQRSLAGGVRGVAESQTQLSDQHFHIMEKLQENKVKILKWSKEKRWITYKRMKRLSADISITRKPKSRRIKCLLSWEEKSVDIELQSINHSFKWG